MEITDSKKDKYTLICLTGKLDTITSPRLEEKLLKIIDNGENNFIFDCSGLDYISSAGLRVLLMGAKKVKVKSGKIVLTALKKHIKEVFDIAGFTAIFPIFETVEQGETSF